LAYQPHNFAASTCQVGLICCTSPNSFNGVTASLAKSALLDKLASSASVASVASAASPATLASLASVALALSACHNGLIDLIGHNCLIGFIGLGLVGFIVLGFVGFTSHDLISLVGLIGYISLVGLGGFSGINNFSLIGFIGLIGYISSTVSLTSLSALWLHQICNHAKMKSHSNVIKYAHGVATVQSRATKTNNAAIWYCCAASLFLSLLFARESWLRHVPCRLNLFLFGDT
jgi:hypothetical protein